MLQQLDYLEFIDFYHERIKAFHVKDAEFRPNGKAGVYGSYSGWAERPGRFRSLGDGQIDFGGIFTKLTHHGYRRLGGARMGMRLQASRTGRGRGRAVHRPAHDPQGRQGVRRFRRDGGGHGAGRASAGLASAEREEAGETGMDAGIHRPTARSSGSACSRCSPRRWPIRSAPARRGRSRRRCSIRSTPHAFGRDDRPRRWATASSASRSACW